MTFDLDVGPWPLTFDLWPFSFFIFRRAFHARGPFDPRPLAPGEKALWIKARFASRAFVVSSRPPTSAHLPTDSEYAKCGGVIGIVTSSIDSDDSANYLAAGGKRRKIQIDFKKNCQIRFFLKIFKTSGTIPRRPSAFFSKIVAAVFAPLPVLCFFLEPPSDRNFHSIA